MNTFDSKNYGPLMAEFLDGDRSSPLGPAPPDALCGRLSGLSTEEVFGEAPIVDDAMARACVAGLWLLHNDLDTSHRICQKIDTPEGEYWHGIMHRREPDFSNAKYWFRRIGQHPVFVPLAQSAGRLAENSPAPVADQLAKGGPWDPFRFVDLCAEASGSGDADEMLLRQVAQCEWELLFDFCYRHAVRSA